MVKFIEITTLNETTLIINVSAIQTIIKDDDEKAIIYLKDKQPIAADMDYQKLKDILIPNNESVYNDPDNEFIA